MKSKRILSVLMPLAIAVITLLLLMGAVSATAQATPPTPGSIVGLTTRTFANSRVFTGSNQITYTTSPLFVAGGLDVSKSGGYYSADSFVSASLDQTSTVSIIPQVSPDRSIWVSLPYTATWTTTADAVSGQTDLQQFVMGGEYLRYTIVSSGSVTVTIKATLHNNK